MEHQKNRGANVQLWTKESVPQQQFKVTYLNNGYYSIVAVHSGKSLDVDKAGYYSGTNIAQSDYTGYAAQQWIIKEAGDGYYYVISKCNGLYIDIYHARNFKWNKCTNM